MYLRRRIRTITALLASVATAACLALAVAGPATAVAATSQAQPSTSPPVHIGAGYTGYGFLTVSTEYSNAATTTSAWRWSSIGWTAASLDIGASVYTAPFGSGWSWAYRDGAWYAVATSSIAVWSCTTSAGGGPWVQIPPAAPTSATGSPQLIGGPDTRAFRSNSSRAPIAGNVARGSYVQLLCANTFPSAYDLRYITFEDQGGFGADDGSQPCAFLSYRGGVAPQVNMCTHVEEPFVLVKANIGGVYRPVYLHAVTGFDAPYQCCAP